MSSFRREREARTGMTSLAPPSRTPPGSVVTRRRTPLSAAALVARNGLDDGCAGVRVDSVQHNPPPYEHKTACDLCRGLDTASVVPANDSRVVRSYRSGMYMSEGD
jgi:hypothetical protein